MDRNKIIVNANELINGAVVRTRRLHQPAQSRIKSTAALIPVGQITAMQFKPADFWGNGFIAFTLGHGRFKIECGAGAGDSPLPDLACS